MTNSYFTKADDYLTARQLPLSVFG